MRHPVVIRLADYRKRPEPDAMSIMLDTYTLLALANIAVLYGLICCCRITAARAGATRQ